VQLTQTLTPTAIGGQGTVRIEYDVVNGIAPHNVGLLLEMDTKISGNDTAPISTSYGYTAIETCFEPGGVPNTWQAFEVAPNQDPSLLVGCGILNGKRCHSPEPFCCGPVGRILQWCWMVLQLLWQSI